MFGSVVKLGAAGGVVQSLPRLHVWREEARGVLAAAVAMFVVGRAGRRAVGAAAR